MQLRQILTENKTYWPPPLFLLLLTSRTCCEQSSLLSNLAIIFFVTFFGHRYGLRGRELISSVGKIMLQGGGTFGVFMSIGTAIRCP